MKASTAFIGLRSKLYTEALEEYPDARKGDIQDMYRYLNPQTGDYILGFSEGNGFFCQAIAEAVGIDGHYLVTDPSQDQLNSLLKRSLPHQVKVRRMAVEELEVLPNFFDKVWSLGGFHHCLDQTEAMKRIYKALKSGGQAVIGDVFQGSSVAKHFDKQVARYCETGHEVKFLSEEFSRSICYLAGFQDEKVKIVDLPQKWYFNTQHDIGKFIYKFHAMTKLPGTESQKIQQVLEGCKEVLTIEYRQGRYELNWPIKAFIATK